MAQAADIFTFRVDDTAHRLEESLRTLEWALAQLPEKLYRSTMLAPHAAFGVDCWSAAMNVAHLALYDERLALPMVESLAAGGDGTGVLPSYAEGSLVDETARLSERPLDEVLSRLRAARQRQVALTATFTEELFNTPMTPSWRGIAGTSLKSPGWVLNKTFQHTWEHGNAILQIALFAVR